METTSHIFHPAFKLNGLHYQTVDELLSFTKVLEQEGDDHEVSISNFIQEWFNDSDTITVKTSGSTGKPKKITLFKSSMELSAKATGTYFKVAENTSVLLCLSADFIAGKMMLVRAMVLGWDLHVVAPERDAITQYDNAYDFVAMVPYQVYHAIDALEKVKKIIIGGGVVSKELSEKLQHVSTEAFATYGMTETYTHVAVRRLNGMAKSDIFSAFPNVKFSKDDRDCLVISAPELLEEPIVTNDLVELYSPISFKWIGRYDTIINSGGIKIYPETIEEKLASYIEFPFIVASEADVELGERVILVVENTNEEVVPDYSEAFSTLSAYERPKKVYTVSKFPYTATGKIKKLDVLQLLRKYK